MKIAIDVAGFSAAESDGFRSAMGTWRSSKEMEKLHAALRRRLHRRQRPDRRAGRGAVPPGRRLRQLRLQQEPRRRLRAHRVRVGLPEALLPGPVRDRPDQRAADGLLPGRGAHQRRQAPRRVRAAGGRQPQPLPDGHRVGRPCPTSHSPMARASTERPPSRPLVGLRRARPAGTRLLGRANCRPVTASALACTSSRASARPRARRSTPRSSGAGRSRRSPDLVARTELSEEVVERLIRGGRARLAGRAAAQAAVAAARGRRRDAGRYDGRRVGSKKAQGRPLDLRLPPTAGARPTTTDRARTAGRRLRHPVARRAPPGDRAVPAGAGSAGCASAPASWRRAAGQGEDRRAGRHPPAPDDRARHGLPGARGRDRHGQRHALAGHLGAFPGRRSGAMRCSTSRAGSSASRTWST